MAEEAKIEAAHKAKCDTSAYTKYLERMQAKFAEAPSPENHAGVYLAEYNTDSILATPVRFVSDVLAGVPSIVVGILGY